MVGRLCRVVGRWNRVVGRGFNVVGDEASWSELSISRL